MNEKIKTLWDDAFFHVEHELENIEDDPIPAYAKHLLMVRSKFAELIIKECIRIANTAGETDPYPGNLIKEHFGVEEQEKVVPRHKCSVCGTTENVRWVGGYLPYLCDDVDCIPF